MSRSTDNHPIRPVAEDAEVRKVTPARAAAPGPGVDQLREIAARQLELLRQYRRLFLAVFGTSAVVLIVAIMLQTPLYESTALMLVKVGRELLYQPEIGAERSFGARDKASVINSELAIVRSQPVVQGVVAAVGAERLYPNLADSLAVVRAQRGEDGEPTVTETLLLAEAQERLRASITAQALPDADVLQLSFQHRDPIVAADTVNALVDNFLDAHLSAFAEPEIVSFLELRVGENEERLAQSEREMREFETDHAEFGFEVPQTALLEARAGLRAQIETIEGQISAIRMRHLQDDPSVAEARRLLLALEVESSQLRGSAQRDVKDRIRVVRRFIAERKAETDEQLQILAVKRESVEVELAVTERELSQLPSLSSRYRRLLRERDADEEQYSTYLRRLREARISTAMDREKIASINVIQPATPAPFPVWPPSRGLSAIIAIALALIAAGLAVALVDRIGPTGIAWIDGDPRRGTAS